jgi:hypothetical protein
VEPSIILLSGIVLILSHCCAYKFGKYQGWIASFRNDSRCRSEKDGMVLREGETFLGVVDVRKGPYFFIANVRKDLNYE